MNQNSPADSVNGGGFFIGVELGPAILRAGVFTSEGLLKGKVKVSAKLERGPAVVMERLAKCVRYAVDECDLRMTDIGAVGVAMPGQVGADGLLVRSSAMGWENLNVPAALSASLGRLVVAGQLYELSAMGIQAKEFAHLDAIRVLVVFPNPQIGAAMLVDGVPAPLNEGFRDVPVDDDMAENILAKVPHPVFGSFRGRDFRKAFKRESGGALKAYSVQLSALAGELAAKLAARLSPEVIILGGTLVDEVGGELLQVVRTAYGAAGGPNEPRIQWELSGLGDLAAITGAACFAKSRSILQRAEVPNAPSLQGSLPA